MSRLARSLTWLNSPLPQALFVALVAAAKFSRAVRHIDDLRLAYGVAMTLVFGAIYLFARRRGVHLPGWFTLVLLLYVAAELLLPVFPFYYDTPFINRVEHFTGFVVLTLFMLLVVYALLRRVPSGRELLLIAAAAWAVGLGNELIEFKLYDRYVFLNRDTTLDLTMNTLAIIVVTLVVPRLLRLARTGGRQPVV